MVNPTWDVVAVFTGYFKDDQHSEVAMAQNLSQVLRGVFATNP